MISAHETNLVYSPIPGVFEDSCFFLYNYLTFTLKCRVSSSNVSLTVQLLNGNCVVVGKTEVAHISLMPRIHQRLLVAGVSQPQRVAYLVGSHQKQIHA